VIVHAEQRADTRTQHNSLNRLGKKVVRASLNATHHVVVPIERREQDDGYEAPLRMRPAFTAHLEAIHAWHHHIADDQVERLGPKPLKSLGTARCEVEVVWIGVQQRLYCLKPTRLIIDHQDPTSRAHC
jgi:hypothetical protein